MSADEPVSKFGYQHGDRIVGYRLRELIGAGNFGEVWKAHGSGVMVAIKILDLTEMAGKVERRALDRIREIRSTNLLPIFGIYLLNRDGGVIEEASSSSQNLPAAAGAATAVFDPADRLVIAMQLGEMSLFDRLEQCRGEGKKGIPCKELLRYMQGAAQGIDYLNEPRHDLGNGPVSIVHGDIKPQNLLLVGGGVQVCDYSLVRPVEDVQKTAMGGSCTPAYAAPELHVNKPCVTSDQYCLAMSYVELRTGNLPFPADTKVTDLFYVKYERRLDLSELKPEVREVVLRATEPNEKARFGSCCEMVEALSQAEELRESTKHRYFPVRVRISRKTWKRVSVAFLAVAVAAAAACYYLRPKPPSEEIDRLIQQGNFLDAFEETLTLRRFGRDDRKDFGRVRSKWSERVAALGQQYDFRGATEVLLSTPAKIDDREAAKEIRDARAELWEKQLPDDWASFLATKSPEELLQQGILLDEMQKKYGERDADVKNNLANWQAVLLIRTRDAYVHRASKPEKFTADMLAALLAARHIPKENQDQIIAALRENLAARFSDSLTSYPFVLADQILKNVDDIAHRQPDIFRRLNFQVAQQRARRERAEFLYFVNDSNDRNAALDFINDKNMDWPQKAKDRADLAQAWYKDLAVRLANAATIGGDFDFPGDCKKFLDSFPNDQAVSEVRLMPAKYEAAKRPLGDPVADLDKELTPALLKMEPEAILSSVGALIDKAARRLDEDKDSERRKTRTNAIETRRRVALALHSQDRAEAENAAANISPDEAKYKWEEVIGKFHFHPIHPGVNPPNPDEILAAAIAALEQGERALGAARQKPLETARQKLAEIEKLLPGMPQESGKSWRRKVDLWKCMVNLAALRPAAQHVPASPQSIQAWRAEMQKIPEGQAIAQIIKAAQAPLICKQLEGVAQSGDKELLDASMNRLAELLVPFSTKSKEILPVLDALFQKRIDMLLQEAAPGKPISKIVRDEFERLDKIWKTITSGTAEDGAVMRRAWEIEYRILLSQNSDESADALSDGMALPARSGPYVSYVRCLAAHENKNEPTDAFLNDLNDVLLSKTPPSPTADRRKNARQWAADAVQRLCKDVQAGASGDIFHESFPKDRATPIYALLKQLQADGWEFDNVLKLASAFAGLYIDPRDFDPAEKLLASVDFRNDQTDARKQAAAALPLLFAYLDQRLRPDPQNRLEAAGQVRVLNHAAAFLRAFPKLRPGALSEREATRIIESVLNPAAALAGNIAAGAKGNLPLERERAELYEAAYDFSEAFSNVPWRDQSQEFANPKTRSARRAVILNSAVDALTVAQVPVQEASLKKTLARLLHKRARLRILSSNLNLDGAIGDAQRANQYDAGLAVARYVVCAKAHLMKARATISDTAKLGETGESIENCVAADRALSPQDAGAKADVLLVQSAALVDLANYERDVTFENQRKHLRQAIADANEAVNELAKLPQPATGHRRREEPDLALGNAYEDLAWIGDENAPENYARAIECFQHAHEKEGLGGGAGVGIGRCFFRIAAQSGFKSDEFNGKPMQVLHCTSEDKARDLAEADLSGAVLFEPGDQAQAEFYLAALLDGKRKFAEADSHFDKLVACAGDDESTKSNFCYLRACSYLTRWETARSSGSPGEAEDARKNAEALVRQIDACKASPVDDAFDSRKQSVRLKADMKRLEGDLEGARKILDDELSRAAPNFTAGHAQLLHARGRLALQLAVKAAAVSKAQAVDLCKASIADFESEVQCVRMREDLLAAHLLAAFSAVIAHRISSLEGDEGKAAAARDFYPKAVLHLKEGDRLWQRGPRKEYDLHARGVKDDGLYYYVNFMFTDRLNWIRSNSERNRLRNSFLSPDDARSAIKWADYLVELNPGDQEIPRGVDNLKRLLGEYLQPPPAAAPPSK